MDLDCPSCHLCGKTENLSICSGCEEVFYCGQLCQIKDWPEHKIRCKEVQAKRRKEKVHPDGKTQKAKALPRPPLPPRPQPPSTQASVQTSAPPLPPRAPPPSTQTPTQIQTKVPIKPPIHTPTSIPTSTPTKIQIQAQTPVAANSNTNIVIDMSGNRKDMKISDDIDDFESGFSSADHPSRGERFRSVLDSLVEAVLHKSMSSSDTQEVQNEVPQVHQEECVVDERYAIFGVPLEEAIKKTACTVQDVPDIIVYCVSYILRFGMDEEGIFRLSGSLKEINKIKDMFQRGEIPPFDVTGDPNVITGLLKQYLRALPSPIFESDQDLPSSGNAYRDTFDAIKEIYKPTALLLLNLFSGISKNCEITRMTSKNIAIVLSPTLQLSGDVLESLISNYDELFSPDELPPLPSTWPEVVIGEEY